MGLLFHATLGDLWHIRVEQGQPFCLAPVKALRQLSAFRRRQPDLLTLPTLSVNDVANLIAMEVEKRGYEGVGEAALLSRPDSRLAALIECII